MATKLLLAASLLLVIPALLARHPITAAAQTNDTSFSNNRTSLRVCPPPGFDSAAKFSLAKYIAAPW
jgi:hypothetical protein